MKIFELINIALKSITFKRSIVPIIGMAIATYCFIFAININTGVQFEKSQPFEIEIEDVKVTDQTISKILETKDVLNATAIKQVSAAIEFLEYSADMTLTGISNDYYDNISFPENAVMPYIILNDAAIKLFEIPKDSATPNWSDLDVTVKVNEKQITGKIFGILDDESEMPKAFISLDIAKEMTDSIYDGAYVKIQNIGFADKVSNEIKTLNLTVSNIDESQQSIWDNADKEVSYLIIISIICLFATTIILSNYHKIDKLICKNQYESMLQIGFLSKDILMLSIMKFSIQSLLGILCGILLYMIVKNAIL